MHNHTQSMPEHETSTAKETRSASFIVERHESFEDLGLRLGWRPDFDPAHGLQTAHDLLEHLDEDDDLDGEVRAFGAMIWVRAQTNWWGTRVWDGCSNPADNVAVELYQFVGQALFQDRFELSEPDIEDLMVLDEHQTPAWVSLLLERVWDRWEKFIEDDKMAFAHWMAQDKEVGLGKARKKVRRKMTRAWRRMVRPWVRVGYARAHKHYSSQGIKPEQAALLFSEIRRRVNDALNNEEVTEGCSVCIQWTPCLGIRSVQVFIERECQMCRRTFVFDQDEDQEMCPTCLEVIQEVDDGESVEVQAHACAFHL